MKKIFCIFLLMLFSFFLASDSLGGVGYFLTVNIVGTGTVDRNPDKEYYDLGENVTLTAEPGKGWKFSKWAGDLNSADNPEIINMDNHKTVYAIFVKIPVTPSRNLLLLD